MVVVVTTMVVVTMLVGDDDGKWWLWGDGVIINLMSSVQFNSIQFKSIC